MNAAYAAIAGEPTVVAECVYAVHLYPERRAELFARYGEVFGDDAYEADRLGHQGLEQALAVTGAHLDEIVERLAGGYDVVGFTTSMAQLFSSLAVASRLKQRSPGTRVVLGGMGTFGVAQSILGEYPFVDYIVQGEGEKRLLHLLRGLGRGDHPVTGHGIYSQAGGERDRPTGFTLELVDRRDGFRLITLDEAWRRVCLDAMEIRSGQELARGAAQAGVCGEDKVRCEILPGLTAERLMFEEGGK
jgi:hypothetical protein